MTLQMDEGGALMLDERMREIYDCQSGALMRALLIWTHGDWQTAEDLLQETMMRAWHNIEALNPDPAKLRPWLLTVARRIAIDRLRSRGARPLEFAVTEFERLHDTERVDPYEALLDRQLLRGVLSSLTELHREALVHVYLLDRTVPEAAAVMGVPEGTVKSRIHHALRAARRRVEACGDGSKPSMAALASG